MTLRRPLFFRYAVLITVLAGAALLASGAVEIYFSDRQYRATLAALQRDNAAAAASSVSRFIEDLAHQLGEAITPATSAVASDLEKRRIDYLKLLRLAPAVTTLRFVDPHGIERVQVSRMDADTTNSKADLSRDAGFVAARAGRTHFGPVYFFEETEPYMRIAVPDTAGDGSVTLAEVNLKFIWSVVSGIKVGEKGYAYVVDAGGRLVAHPDIHQVLQMTDLSGLPQVRAALAERGVTDAPSSSTERAVDPQGRAVLTAHTVIQPLGWHVFVEQPHSEALAPLYASLTRHAVILLLALALALLASATLARTMVAPIRKLQSGAQKIGAGDLAHRIHVATGDELEELAKQFNHMGAQLQESYADLERRIAERTRDLEAANQAKSRFLAAASHDLRQPIHALALLAAQLDTSGHPAEHDDAIAQIKAGIETLGGLFDDLLDISKLEAGAVVAQREDFAVSAVLDAIRTQFAPEVREQGLKLKVLPNNAYVHSDPVLLQRILTNFVSNAVRYTERGGVLVGARRRGASLQIAVWDSGCGIPEERREDIFREFVQLDSPNRDRGKGLGLGLAIVARLAPLLGSAVELKSVPGKGSMFAIRVPLADPAKAEHAISIHRYDNERSHGSALRGVFVMVVDDDESARAGMQGLLEGWGCLAIAADSAAEALVLLPQHDRALDLLICDYHLSAGENGIEAIRRVRAASNHAMPAILVTGDACRAVLEAAKEHGHPVIHKPVAPAKLRALLNQVLARAPDAHGTKSDRALV
ncbi:MAG TPA: ATP-binding protein [Burkholderiales bacterium]|nr:ATP-binding protein [Burkholderiales bacterium]